MLKNRAPRAIHCGYLNLHINLPDYWPIPQQGGWCWDKKIVPTEQLNASHCCRLTAVDNPSMYSILPQSQIYIPSPQVELDNYGDGCRHLGGIGSYSSDDSAT